MKIEVIDTFKSVGPFTWDNIPSLSIITGLNGAGKSQLLDLIRTKPDIVQTDDSIIYKLEDITFWNSDGGRFPNSHSFQIFDLVAFAATLRNFSDPYKKVIEAEAAKKPIYQRKQQQIAQLEQSTPKLSFDINKRESEIIKLIEDSSGKNFYNLGFEEIMYHFPEQLFLDSDNINSDRIETLFYMYHYRKTMDAKAGMDMTNYPTPPWDLLNQVFAISNLPFEIDNPSSIPIDFDIANLSSFFKEDPRYKYSIKLTHKLLNKVIDFKDISSGEKTIMSLAFLHYYAQKKKSYKKLLLLDEPDAHLHPSLTKQFLEVVDKFLIKQYGAKVIMTTHSPSTVGLCDEDSIFIMSKDPTKIDKQTRSEAINYLTSGVPILSSIIDNRRYILVEDTDDAKYFTRIYNIVSQEIDDHISIVFIAVSTPEKSGGCSVVKGWSEKLRTGGMSLFKGLIDKDQGNTPEAGVVVLKRYSMENYFLDPILVAGFLVHHGLVTNIAGINFPGQNCNLIENLTETELQSIADYIVNLIETDFTTKVDAINATRAADKKINSNVLSANEKQIITVTFKNSKKVNYPKWVISRRGHDLETIYRESLPRTRVVGLVPMLDIQVRLPAFIPTDLIQTLKECL